MIALSLIIGIGVVCFLLLYFAFNLKEQHFLLQLLALFFFIFLMFLIPKAALDYNDNCGMVINQTSRSFIDANNFTDTNTYMYYCEPNNKTTALIFYKTVTWFVSMFALYVLIYLIWYSFKWIDGVVRGKKD